VGIGGAHGVRVLRVVDLRVVDLRVVDLRVVDLRVVDLRAVIGEFCGWCPIGGVEWPCRAVDEATVPGAPTETS